MKLALFLVFYNMGLSALYFFLWTRDYETYNLITAGVWALVAALNFGGYKMKKKYDRLVA